MRGCAAYSVEKVGQWLLHRCQSRKCARLGEGDEAMSNKLGAGECETDEASNTCHVVCVMSKCGPKEEEHSDDPEHGRNPCVTTFSPRNTHVVCKTCDQKYEKGVQMCQTHHCSRNLITCHSKKITSRRGTSVQYVKVARGRQEMFLESDGENHKTRSRSRK